MKCDELKKYKAYEFGTSYVYHIEEVNAAIEELKAKLEQLLIEIVKLKKKLVEQATLRVWAELQLRHNKYKRCLAMAEWCKCKRIDAADYRIPREKWEFYDKWYKRWIKIAELFKEAK